jgi:hypothetical protein
MRLCATVGAGASGFACGPGGGSYGGANGPFSLGSAASGGQRAGGLGWQVGQRRHRNRNRNRNRGDRVIDRSELSQRGEELVGLGRVADVDGLDDHECLAADLLGQLRERREIQEPAGSLLTRQDGGSVVVSV